MSDSTSITELALSVRAGEACNFALLLDRMLPKVESQAHKIASRNAVDVEDLLQVASLAILEAVERYDEEKGAFRPYAAEMARREMLHEAHRERARGSGIGRSQFRRAFNEDRHDELSPAAAAGIHDVLAMTSIEGEAASKRVSPDCLRLRDDGANTDPVGDDVADRLAVEDALVRMEHDHPVRAEVIRGLYGIGADPVSVKELAQRRSVSEAAIRVAHREGKIVLAQLLGEEL